MIRNGKFEDAAAIAQIHVRTWRAAYMGIVPAGHLAALSEEERAAMWRERLKDDRSLILVAIENDEMAGWASGGFCRDPDAVGAAEIYGLYVSPSYWGKLIGRQLLENLEVQLPTSDEITLWVLRENRRAIRFYQKMGYQGDGAEKEFKAGKVGLPEIRLRKKGPASRQPASS